MQRRGWAAGVCRPVRRRVRGAAALGVAAAVLALVAAPPVAAAPRAQDPVGGPQLAAKGVVVQPGPGTAPLPRIGAKAWVLADITTGEVLAAKNAHLRLPPASTLKTLTSLTLLPRLDPEQVYRARPSDVAAEGGHVGIVAGATYTVEDLFNGLLLPSGNDAAAALAHANGGMRRTVEQMNAEAARLQAVDTVARNPSGLDAPGQVSTPYDLVLIARAGLARDDFSAYVSRISADFPGYMPKKPGKPRKTYKIYNQNRLLLHGFPGTVGVKTGYTTQAGRTFVGAARRHGHTLVVALMQITDWSETAAGNALNWGFANRDTLTAVGTLADPLPEGAQPVTAPDGDGGTAEGAAAGNAGVSGGGAVAARADAPAGGPVPGPVRVGALVAAVAVLVGGLAVLRATRRPRPVAPAGSVSAGPRHARGST